MAIIDDEGRIFGLVNIIDLLVVVVLVVVIGGGVMFVLSAEDPDDPGQDNDIDDTNDAEPLSTPDSRYVTLDIGAQPDRIVASIEEEIAALEEGPPSESENVTITDLYRGPEGDSVIVRANVSGERVEIAEDDWQFRFEDEPIRFGQQIDLQGDAFAISGEVIDRNAEGPTLDVRSIPVVLETHVSTRLATGIEASDLSDDLVRVEHVNVYPTDDPNVMRVVIGAELVVREDGERTLFGDQRLREGVSVHLETETNVLDSTVVEVGTMEEPGEQTTTVVTVEMSDMPPDRVDNLAVGMTETHAGQTYAEIVEINATPATMLVQTADGELRMAEHPENLDVTMTVELQTREVDDRIQFRGETLRIGESIVLDVGHQRVTVELVSVDS